MSKQAENDKLLIERFNGNVALGYQAVYRAGARFATDGLNGASAALPAPENRISAVITVFQAPMSACK